MVKNERIYLYLRDFTAHMVYVDMLDTLISQNKYFEPFKSWRKTWLFNKRTKWGKGFHRITMQYHTHTNSQCLQNMYLIYWDYKI